MKMSFLVTYYNQEEYVRQSMDSILSIEMPEDWEILIGDDGSDDGTRETIREYTERNPDHIRMYVMPRESGKKYDSVRRASANRLNLLEHSTGDCFCILDGDDFYTDCTFAKEALEILSRHREVSVVACAYQDWKDGKMIATHRLNDYPRHIVNKRDYLRNRYLHAGACVHRICWKADRVEEMKKIGFFDDNNILINSLQYGEMYYIDKPVYAYRQTGDSIYTSMRLAEKSILNVQGLDVDLKLLDSKWHRDLRSRYANPLEIAWVLRKKLPMILGDQKHRKYLDGCRAIGNSIGEILLDWNNAGEKEKRSVRRLIRKTEVDNPLRVLYARMSIPGKGRAK